MAAWATLFHQLARYHWPGNVRELSNVAQQLVAAQEPVFALSGLAQSMLQTPSESFRVEEKPVQNRKMQDIANSDFDAAMQACAFEAARGGGVFTSFSGLGVSQD